MSVANPGIVLKAPPEISRMRAAGRLVARLLDELAERVAPGVTTAELNEFAQHRMLAAGATPLFRGVRNDHARFPYPACICASVNEVIVHGIPDERPLQAGDIVSVDAGVRLDGYCADAARTFSVGPVDADRRRLLDVTAAALALAIDAIRPGRRWAEIADQMQQFVEGCGLGVVRGFVGHGIGRELHEEPKVPGFVDRSGKHADFILTPGMTIAVEPMVTLGSPEFRFRDASYWAVVTRDGSPAAHMEHCVAVTDDGAIVLTDGR